MDGHLLVNSRCECSTRKLGWYICMYVCIGSDQFFRRINLKVQNRPKMVCKTYIFFSVGTEITGVVPNCNLVLQEYWFT